MPTYKHSALKILICYSSGIFIAYYTPRNLYFSIVCVLSSVVPLLVSLYYSRKQLKNSIFSWYALCFFIGLGYWSLNIHTDTNYKTHYSKQINLKENNILSGTLSRVLKSTAYYKRYILSINSINDTSCFGQTIIKISKRDSSSLTVGDKLLISATIQELPSHYNPGQFNYTNYLNQKNIYHTISAEDKHIKTIGQEKTVYAFADKIRENIKNNLKHSGLEEKCYGLLNALLLGEKHDLSKDLQSKFSNAGVIHILAISGLHIGLITWFLNLILYPLKRIIRLRSYLPFAIILFLWIYAFFTGLSPSVLRATTMFSLLTYGYYLQRITNPYHTLCVSAIILLVFNPFYLFDVGFQLSYSAVCSILLFRRLFGSIWAPKSKILKYCFGIVSVTLSAQIGVLPLTLYYFNYFPVLFLISNIIAIPIVSVCVAYGLILCVAGYFNVPPYWLVKPYNWILNFFIERISAIGDTSNYVITNIPFSLNECVGLYFVILCFIRVLYKFKLETITRAVFSIFILNLIVYYSRTIQPPKDELIVFNQYKTTLIGLKKGETSLFLTSKETQYTTQTIEQYCTKRHISQFNIAQLYNHLSWKNRTITVVDKKGIYDTSFDFDIVLLSQSPKINLERLIKLKTPKLILMDHSNYESDIILWKQTCTKEKIPYHVVHDKGPYILN